MRDLMSFGNVLGSFGNTLKAVHDALGGAGRARGVEQNGDIGARTLHPTRQGLAGTPSDGVPAS